jgi:rubrerythrin
MTNAELIATLRGENYFVTLLHDAADALEAAEKRIAELEAEAAFFDAEKLNYRENIEYRDERIKELETQLPKEGEWIDLFGHDYKCSVCGEWYRMDGTPEQEDMNYCPNCGARMDGKDGERDGRTD